MFQGTQVLPVYAGQNVTVESIPIVSSCLCRGHRNGDRENSSHLNLTNQSGICATA